MDVAVSVNLHGSYLRSPAAIIGCQVKKMKAPAMRLILASSSPRRQELLSQLGLPFEVIKPAIDESRHSDEAPVDYAERLSREKAAAVAKTLDESPALIIAADTIVIDHEGELLGKPADAAEARWML